MNISKLALFLVLSSGANGFSLHQPRSVARPAVRPSLGSVITYSSTDDSTTSDEPSDVNSEMSVQDAGNEYEMEKEPTINTLQKILD